VPPITLMKSRRRMPSPASGPGLVRLSIRPSEHEISTGEIGLDRRFCVAAMQSRACLLRGQRRRSWLRLHGVCFSPVIRHWGGRAALRVWCQFRTSTAVQQFTVFFQLLDHLFGDDEQRWRDDEAECLGSCQV
jgi:hypothetical protein